VQRAASLKGPLTKGVQVSAGSSQVSKRLDGNITGVMALSFELGPERRRAGAAPWRGAMFQPRQFAAATALRSATVAISLESRRLAGAKAAALLKITVATN
jgi:hypothetical protein